MVLEKFLERTDAKQKEEYQKIPLFQSARVKKLSKPHKKWFVKVFYHTRGHFDRLLWTRLVYAPSVKDKKQILQYLAEEAGLENLRSNKNLRSHELLFADFALRLGVRLTPEVTEREGFLPFVHNFTNGLVEWFREHDWESGLVGFSAYERLDNVDYEFMHETAKALGARGKALTFFDVHRQADHFEQTSGSLPRIWRKNPTKVRAAFKFIYSHQLTMWQSLSKETFAD